MKRGKANELSVNGVWIKYFVGSLKRKIFISPKYSDDFIRELNFRIEKHLVKEIE